MDDDPQARMIKARRGDVTVINVYVPNGSEVGSEKYEYKMRWYDALARHLAANHRPDEPLVIVGDFNVAPEERDIYDPVAFRTRSSSADPSAQRWVASSTGGSSISSVASTRTRGSTPGGTTGPPRSGARWVHGSI